MAKQSGYLRRRQAEQKRLYDVGMDVARQVRNETANDLLKMMVIALNDEFGLGNERLRRLADRLYEVTKEWDRLAGPENDVEYARQKVDERIAQIFGNEPVDFRLRY